MVDLARQNWRDYEVDGVAASGKHKPKKSKLRQWGTWVEGIITAFTSNGGLIYTTRTLLYADLLHAANTSAWVVSDSTGAYNGIYQKSGISGAGAWTRVADLPYSFISCTDAGAGTANAIVATSGIPAPSTTGAALFLCNIFEANSGAVTLALNGAAAKPVITNSGNALSSGYLVAGTQVMFIDDGTNWRLVSDVASAAIQAAAEAAQAAAELAAANAALYNDGVWFDTVALLVADATRTYGNTTAGDYIRTRSEGFSYLVAASGASDHHVTTGGGLKLYVRGDNGIYHIKAFNAAGDGTTDDATILNTAVSAVSADDGGILYLTAGSTYLVGTVHGAYNCMIEPKSNVHLIGYGATIKVKNTINGGTGVWAGFNVIFPLALTAPYAANNFKVEGITFDMNGANNLPPDMRHNLAIGLEYGSDFSVINCKFNNAPGFNIVYIGTQVDRYLVKGSKFDTFGQSLAGNTNIIDHSCVYGYGTNGGVHYNEFVNATIDTISSCLELANDNCSARFNTATRVHNLANLSGYATSARNLVVSDNIVKEGEMLVRTFLNPTFTLDGVIIRDNNVQLTTALSAPIDLGTAILENAGSVSVLDNVIDYQGAQRTSGMTPAIYFRRWSNVTISGNTFRNIQGQIAQVGSPVSGGKAVITNNYCDKFAQSTFYLSFEAIRFDSADNSNAYSYFALNDNIFKDGGPNANYVMTFTNSANNVITVLETLRNTVIDVDNLYLSYGTEVITTWKDDSTLLSMLDADFTGTNVDTAQPWFSSGQDSFNLSPGTYEVDGFLSTTRAAGTTSHTTSILYGGGASISSIDLWYEASNPTGVALTAVSRIRANGGGALAVTAANVSATEEIQVRVSGVLRISSGGTFIPQFQYSVAPGGAPTIKKNTFFRLTRIGKLALTTLGDVT